MQTPPVLCPLSPLSWPGVAMHTSLASAVSASSRVLHIVLHSLEWSPHLPPQGSVQSALIVSTFILVSKNTQACLHLQQLRINKNSNRSRGQHFSFYIPEFMQRIQGIDNQLITRQLNLSESRGIISNISQSKESLTKHILLALHIVTIPN